ncbi:MAG: transcription-repair coupling factor [Pirellulaceae bacterium]
MMTNAQTSTSGLTRLRDLSRGVQNLAGFDQAIDALRSNALVTIDGVWGSACALVAATLLKQHPPLLLVVCPHPREVDQFVDDLSLFVDAETMVFPAWDSPAGEDELLDETYGDRLRTLKQLLQIQTRQDQRETTDELPPVVVTSIQSLLNPVPRCEQVLGNSRTIRVGDQFDLEAWLDWLVAQGFHATTAVNLAGEFSSRGGIIDLFAPDWDSPVRVELFGDEVESIRGFEVASQRNLESLQQVEITVPGTTREYDEFITAYLPAGSWVVNLATDQAEELAGQYQDRLGKEANTHDYRQLLERLQQFGLAQCWALAPGDLEPVFRFPMASVERFSGDMDKVRSQLDHMGHDQEVFLVGATQADVDRLQQILRETRLAATNQIHYVLGNLSAGFRLVTENKLLVSVSELFQRKEIRRPKRRRQGRAIDSFLELSEGDLVVHLSHGIARYRGLQIITQEGQSEEHLTLEFHGGTNVYVPVNRIELVQKYVGGSKRRPQLARIGGQSWQRQKQAAQRSVMDVATEMLQLQAARQSRPGITFATDSSWQQDFDAAFPYQETADQQLSIAAVKKDMEAPRPMDRLLCGDVGFGKTEVAMRAAFKAVDSGYQVAVMVPTTILTEQHYRTFVERLAGFPIEVAKLSRFSTTAQQRAVVEGLQSGRTDIVIGTHRLASKDVQFANLGLLIIDEEQRFGVKIKERLKSVRHTVDVLTLSATPIPRTLHLSLVGMRDISNLETPPEDRRSIKTEVTRFQEKLIRQAVLRELNRGGQIYFVHNRVQDIESVAGRLKQIVPEASIGIGHGQMAERELERVMVDFVSHRFDLLLATTIVENGLDIQRANTMFIDEADRYGLADLHQLRGRVGRYKHQGYCYLLIDRTKYISPTASRRLRAIEEFSEMGAGFAIAMRDLEIRGAGNLLGHEQSGHISTIGYELYCQLLEKAVRSLKKMAPPINTDVEIDLPGSAYLPADYVTHQRDKIDLYRRLSAISAFKQIDDLREELRDRFGPLPETVDRLLLLARLRLEAAVWNISMIFREEDFLVFKCRDQQRLEQLVALNPGRLRLVDAQTAYCPIPPEETSWNKIVELLKLVLQLTEEPS